MKKSTKLVAVISLILTLAFVFAGCSDEEKGKVNWSAKRSDPAIEARPTASADKLVAFGAYPSTGCDSKLAKNLDKVVIDNVTGLWKEFEEVNAETNTVKKAWYDPKDGYFHYSDTAEADGKEYKYAKQDGKYYLVQEIQWIILAEEGSNYVLIAREAIDSGRPFLDEYCASTWADSSMRDWLNGTDDYAIGGEKYAETWNFIDRAFTNEEKAKLQAVKLTTEDNDRYGVDGGEDTTDKVYLLSEAEFNKYFSDDTISGQATTTLYAAQRGATAEFKNRAVIWWLRSPGINTYFQGVTRNGDICEGGYMSSDATIGIRPVIVVPKSAVKAIDETLPTAGSIPTPTPKKTAEAEATPEGE